jgi:hypothetical protein
VKSHLKEVAEVVKPSPPCASLIFSSLERACERRWQEGSGSPKISGQANDSTRRRGSRPQKEASSTH